MPMTVMAWCHAILPFSEAAAVRAQRVAPVGRAKLRTVPLAVRTPPPSLDLACLRTTVVTVVYVDRVSFGRKGFDRFLRLAGTRPCDDFVLVGAIDTAASALMQGVPANCTVTGNVGDRELWELLARAKVYVQLSWHEGFGMSMAEAMLAVRCRSSVISRRCARWRGSGRS